jgi:hypothetical protein
MSVKGSPHDVLINPSHTAAIVSGMATATSLGELVESNDLVGDWKALRDRLRRDGYIFVRGLIDPRLVDQAHRQALAALVAAGWCDATSRPTGPVHPHEWTEPGYRGFALAEAVNRLVYEPGPQRLMGDLLGAGAFAYPVKVPRAVYPDALDPRHKGRFVHQDYRVMGKQDLFTMWLPLEDIPPELGGLAVLPGSSRLGWSRPARLQPGAPVWATTSYRPGDALVFHCLTWHAALPNRTDHLRLSMDARWQLAADPAPSRLIFGPGGPARTGGGELLWRVFGRRPWWHPVPKDLRVVADTAPPVGHPIAPSRYVDFPDGLRQPADRAQH